VERTVEALTACDLPIIVTGGDAGIIAPLLRGQVRVDPNLLFYGMLTAPIGR
jgi:hypothetical protein